MFRDVTGCSGMFRNVPECSGMFHVPGFIDAQNNISLHSLLILSAGRLVDQRMSTNWTGVTVKR